MKHDMHVFFKIYISLFLSSFYDDLPSQELGSLFSVFLFIVFSGKVVFDSQHNVMLMWELEVHSDLLEYVNSVVKLIDSASSCDCCTVFNIICAISPFTIQSHCPLNLFHCFGILCSSHLQGIQLKLLRNAGNSVVGQFD